MPLCNPPTLPHSQIQASPSLADSLYTRILIRDLKKLEREAALGRKILECRKNKQYKSNKLGRLLHGVALAHCTKIGVVTMEKIITLSTAAFFANLGFSHETVSDVVASCPSATELKNLMIELAADCILITSKDISGKELALMADKGEDNGKSASFVKLMAYYVSKKVGVKVVCFGIETAGNASKDAACGIDHSLRVFEYGTDQRRILFSMSMTDAGGGGVGSSLVTNLELRNRAVDNCNYLWGTCVLHAMNLMFSVPVETLMGQGGLKKRTFLQALHTAYSLKCLYPNKVWKELWLIGTGSTWCDISKPVLSRWEHVGDAARHLKKWYDQWLVMSQYIINLNNVGKVKCDIASYLISYLKETMLRAQLEFVCAFVTEYYDSHFHWHKHVDQNSKCAGFLSVHTGVHYFVMHRDLVQLQTDWATRDSFQGFLKYYPQTYFVTAQEFVKEFSELSQHRMEKHMDQWRIRNLPLVLGGDTLPATCIANWMLGLPIPISCPRSYYSEKHHTTIDVIECCCFLTAKTTVEAHRQKDIYIDFQPQLRLLACGHDLWSDAVELEGMQRYVRQHYIAFPSNNQLTERWVKDSNECTYLSKDEKMANIYAIVRSCTVMQYTDTAAELLSNRERKGNKYFTSGRKGERVDKRTGEQESISEDERGDSNIRGSLLTSVIIQDIIKKEKKLSGMKVNQNERKNILDHLTKDDNRYESVLRLTEVESLRTHLDQPCKAPNAIQKQTSYQDTPFMRLEIKFSKVITKHIPLLQSELRYLNIIFDAKLKVNALKQLLRENNKTRKKQEFTIQFNKTARDEDVDLLHFKPMHCSAPQWGDAYI